MSMTEEIVTAISETTHFNKIFLALSLKWLLHVRNVSMYKGCIPEHVFPEHAIIITFHLT